MPERSLDAFDRALLRIVQLDAALTSDVLAERVGLSASAVQRRLRRLEDDGVIVGRVAVVDPARVGQPAHFIVALEVERERADLLGRLRQWLMAEPGVQQVFYVTGSADFMLIASARDISAYEAMMTRLMNDNPNVRRFTTHVAMSAPKRTLAIPVDDPPVRA